jgi:hypothetical protein
MIFPLDFIQFGFIGGFESLLLKKQFELLDMSRDITRN